MTDLIQLTDVEIAAVAGGAISQSISVSATQSNSSSVLQSATARNSGAGIREFESDKMAQTLGLGTSIFRILVWTEYISVRY